MSLENEISRSIMEAMKARDAVRLSALRGVKKYIIEARSAGPARDQLPDEETLRILRKLVKQGLDSAEIYRTQGREELTAEELAQVRVMQEFLPAALSPEQLDEALRAIIARLGATSMKDMGRVMGEASKELGDRAEGRILSERVRALLG